MALFEFDLARVEDIVPWGEPNNQSLSWFALTDGCFRVLVGRDVLFQYTDEILSHWKATRPRLDIDYQIAAFARDILGSVAPGVARLPKDIERLASNWELLNQLRQHPDSDGDGPTEDGLSYTAWRWLGERSPWTSYLAASPNLAFVRIGDELQIHWDNREHLIHGVPVWTAQLGVYVLPVAAFLEECREFADRLLAAMADRITGIEAGVLRTRIEVDVGSLRQQQATWSDEFASYFKEYKPDISWPDAERALRAIAQKCGVRF